MKRAMVGNITGFALILLLYRDVYINSVTIAYYSILLIALCHSFHSEKLLIIGN